MICRLLNQNINLLLEVFPLLESAARSRHIRALSLQTEALSSIAIASCCILAIFLTHSHLFLHLLLHFGFCLIGVVEFEASQLVLNSLGHDFSDCIQLTPADSLFLSLHQVHLLHFLNVFGIARLSVSFAEYTSLRSSLQSFNYLLNNLRP